MMPVSPRARCSVWPCPNLKPCPLHSQAKWRGVRSQGYRSRNGQPTDWPKIRAAVLRRDGYVCALCGDDATIADHIIPRSRGGSDDLSNLQALCNRCSHTKTGREGRAARR